MVVTNHRQLVPEKSPFDLHTYMSERQNLVEAALNQAMPLIYPERIFESMRYSLLAGGKRIRPILCLATCELAGGTMEMAMPTACGVEMVHTMSLIHDDLPSMDNDDYRRGQLTNHKVFGEDIAILAGDGLLAFAFEHIALQTKNVAPEFILKVMAELGRAAGAKGLVGGQVVDLECEGQVNVSLETLNFIHNHKTAALLEVSVTSGAMLVGAPPDDIKRLSNYAQNIGLAFQIVDDILDITSTREQLGKSVGKDIQSCKATYPSIWGLEESQRRAQQLIIDAKAELEPFGENALPLMALADFIIDRTH